MTASAATFTTGTSATKLDEAISEHQWLLRRDPYRVDSYQKLYKLYFDARAYDKAWCLARTLTFLNKADAEQQQFFADNRPSGPIRPTNRLNDERWLKDLASSEQDLLVSKIFEQIWPAVLSLRIQNDKDAGLNKKHEVDPANSTVTFARTFGFVANVLGMPAPRLFLRTDVNSVRFEHARPRPLREARSWRGGAFPAAGRRPRARVWRAWRFCSRSPPSRRSRRRARSSRLRICTRPMRRRMRTAPRTG